MNNKIWVHQIFMETSVGVCRISCTSTGFSLVDSMKTEREHFKNLTLYQTTNFKIVPNSKHLQTTNKCNFKA